MKRREFITLLGVRGGSLAGRSAGAAGDQGLSDRVRGTDRGRQPSRARRGLSRRTA